MVYITCIYWALVHQRMPEGNYGNQVNTDFLCSLENVWKMGPFVQTATGTAHQQWYHNFQYCFPHFSNSNTVILNQVWFTAIYNFRMLLIQYQPIMRSWHLTSFKPSSSYTRHWTRLSRILYNKQLSKCKSGSKILFNSREPILWLVWGFQLLYATVSYIIICSALIIVFLLVLCPALSTWKVRRGVDKCMRCQRCRGMHEFLMGVNRETQGFLLFY